MTTESYGRQLFANKFIWDFQPAAWDCMNVWHHVKMERERLKGKTAMDTSYFTTSSYIKHTRPVPGY